LFFLVAQWCVWPQAAWSDTSDDLRAALGELEQMRYDGKIPPYDDAEKRVAELLEEYPDPAHQGKIWFQLVKIYGQTAGPPERIIEGVQKALEFPHEPPQQIRLYIYWGDALMFLDPDGPLPERRRAAAAVCLEGLMELKKLRPAEGEEDSPAAKALNRHHDALIRQLTGMYFLRPYATEELRDLAAEKTGDPELVDQLLGKVEPKIKTDIAKFGPEPRPREPAPPPDETEAGSLLTRPFLVLANLAAIAILVGAFAGWKYRTRGVRKTE